MRNEIRCCRDCVPPKRHPGCHATCEKYAKEKAEFEKHKSEYWTKRIKEIDYIGYEVGKHSKRK